MAEPEFTTLISKCARYCPGVRVIERPFSEFLRQPNQVIADLADHDIVLRRRNAPALRLSEADREEDRHDAFAMLARLLKSSLAHSPAGLETAIDEAFPWAMFLPRRDRNEFVDQLTRTLLGISMIDDFAPVGRLLREWKVAAEINADQPLARRLRSGLDASGDSVPSPEWASRVPPVSKCSQRAGPQTTRRSPSPARWVSFRPVDVDDERARSHPSCTDARRSWRCGCSATDQRRCG